MTQERWRGYEWIWTTHADEFLLVRSPAEGKDSLIIYRATPTSSS